MSRICLYALVALTIEALAPTPANAWLNCLKDHKPFKLTGDSIEYSMAIAPGADCIQGLRSSTMQIYAVWVLEEPKSGELVMVGPAFHYFAKPGFSGTDKFSLVVVGKNLREEGYSTVEINVSLPNAAVSLDAVGKPASDSASKLADAAAAR